MSKNPYPTRMCSGCMTRRPKEELIRIVRTKDGKAIVDITGKADGRGAYVCPDENCIKKAEKKNRFPRDLKCEVSKDIYDVLINLADGE